MQQGVDKQINLGGIVRNTAGSTCPDGEMEEIINLRYKDGSLRPISDNKTLTGLEGVDIDYTHIYVHNNAYQHFVGVLNKRELYYFADMDDDGNVTMLAEPKLLLNIEYDDEVQVQYSQTGNLLTVIDGSGIRYLYWRNINGDAEYVSVPTDYNGTATDTEVPPEYCIDFRIANKKYNSTNSPMVRAIASTDKWYTSRQNKSKSEETCANRKSLAPSQMIVSRGISAKLNEPTGYFFVCTALKLYDGSFILQSRPVLITPPNVQSFAKRDKEAYNTVRFTSKSRFSSKSYHKDDKEIFEFPLYVSKSAKSTSLNPYSNPQNSTLFKMVNGVSVPTFCGDLTIRAAGVLDKTNNISGFLDVEKASDNTHGKLCWCKDNQKLFGINYIPDLTCLYGTNLFTSNHGGFTNKTYQSGLHRTRYYFNHILGNNNDYKIDGEGVENCKLSYYIPGYLLQGAGGLLGWNGKSQEHYNWYGVSVTNKNDGNWRFRASNNFMSEELIMPAIGAESKDTAEESANHSTPLYCFNMPHELQMYIHSAIDNSFEDIIESVCVFMTQQVEPLEINNDNVIDYTKAKYIYPATITTYSPTKKFFYAHHIGKDNWDLFGDSLDYLHDKDKVMRRMGEEYYVDERPKSEIKEELEGLQNFYLLSEMKLSDYNRKAGQWITVPIDDGVLENITSQPELNLDSADRKAYQPKTSLMYNGRLHYANYSSSMFLGYPLNYFWNNQINTIGSPTYAGSTAIMQSERRSVALYSWYKTMSNGESIADFMQENGYPAYCIMVELETAEGTRRMARYSYYKQDAKPLQLYNLNPFLSYPDSRAKKMTIITQGVSYEGYPMLYVKKRTYELTPHKIFDLAYYIDNNLNPINSFERYAGGVSPKESDIKDWITRQFTKLSDLGLTDSSLLIEEVPNGLRVSAVNNPIYFPYANNYRVGNMQIIGMATNAIAAGDGQTGAMPLYVFSNDGVNGLFVDASGENTYSNSRPISRDVCNNRRSIANTSYGVAFSTFNGIKLLSGETTQDISDKLEGDYLKFTNTQSNDYLQVASQAISNDKLVQLTDYITNIEFLEFARKGCIIGFNYYEDEIYVTNPAKDDSGEYLYPYSYIINMRTNVVVKSSLVADQYVQNYPETYVLGRHKLKILGKYDNAAKGIQTMFLTRPIKFNSQAFKQGYRSIIRGMFNVVTDSVTACNVLEFSDDNVAPLLRKITIAAPAEETITIEPSDEENFVEVQINKPTLNTLQFDPDESTYEPIEYRSEMAKDLTPTILVKTLQPIVANVTDVTLTNGDTFSLTNELQVADGTNTYQVYSADTSVSAHTERFIAKEPCTLTLQELQDELEYLFSETEPHSESDHLLQYSDDLVVGDYITTNIERGNYVDLCGNTGVISLNAPLALSVSAYNTQGGIATAAAAAGVGVVTVSADGCNYVQIDDSAAPFSSVLNDWADKKAQYNIVLQQDFITEFDETIGTRYIMIDRSFSDYNAFAVYVQNGFCPTGEGVEQPSTEEITLAANVGYIAVDKDNSEYRVSPADTERTMAYNVFLEKAKSGELLDDGSLDKSISLLNGNLYKVFYSHERTTEGGETENVSEFSTFTLSTTSEGGTFVVVVRELLNILSEMEDSGSDYEQTIDGVEINIHFATKDNELLYYPSTITADYGAKLYVVNNTSTDINTGNAKTYCIKFNDSSSIATYQFLQKCENGGYESLPLTTFDNDEILLPAQTNIKLVDNIENKTYQFYNGEIEQKMKYSALIPLVKDGDYFEEPHTLGDTTLAITNGEYVQVNYNEQEYQIQYNGNSYIDAQTLIDNCEQNVYAAAPAVDPNKVISVETRRYTRLITPDKATYDFMLTQSSATASRTLRILKPRVSVTEFNYATLVNHLANRDDSVQNTKGTNYHIEYIDDLDARLSNLRAGIYLFGSYDCRKWQFIGGNEIEGSFRDLGALTERLDCKYFRICFVGNLLPDSTIEYIDMSVESRLLQGKLR